MGSDGGIEGVQILGYGSVIMAGIGAAVETGGIISTGYVYED